MIDVDFSAPLLRALEHARAFDEALPERPLAPRVGAEAVLGVLDGPLPDAGAEPAAVVD
jgi:hypothetical protein